MAPNDMSGPTIPVIDIQAWTQPKNFTETDRMMVAQQVNEACRVVGFFAIEEHGIDPSTIQNAWNASRDFFDLPLKTKLASKTDDEATYPYGYENTESLLVGKNQSAEKAPLSSSSTEAQRPDTKETFSLGPPEGSGMPDRRFPTQPASMEAAMTAYYQAMEGLALTLMRIFAVALELPTREYFDSYLGKHWSALRTLNYPAMSADNDTDDDDTTSVRIRAGKHTDYGALTILRTDGPGLQVQTSSSEGSLEWTDVPVLTASQDVFIINLGDMMQRWTNDEWKSTLHRVVAVKDEASQSYTRRQSMAYFCNIHGNALVSPLPTCCRNQPAKYEPILAKDHLMAKHLASMGYKAKSDESDK